LTITVHLEGIAIPTPVTDFLGFWSRLCCAVLDQIQAIRATRKFRESVDAGMLRDGSPVDAVSV